MAKLSRLAAVRRGRAFARDERAGVLIEFGIIAPVLFSLLLGIFDIALAYFTQVSIEHSASETARVVRVGTMELALTANDDDEVDLTTLVRDVFCANAPLVLNCTEGGSPDERLGLCIISSSSLSTLNDQIQALPFDDPTLAASRACTGDVDDSDDNPVDRAHTHANDYVAMRILYRHTFFTPFLNVLVPNSGTTGSNEVILSYTYVYRNEPS